MKTFINELTPGKSSLKLKIEILRRWYCRKSRMSKSNRHFQMIVQDEKGEKIHVIISNGRFKSINKLFKRGMVAVISDFNVVPNDRLKWTGHPYKIKFHGGIKARSSKRFRPHTNMTDFQVTKFSAILGMNLDRDLPIDIIGSVIEWENEVTEVESSNGRKLKTLGIKLKDETGIVECLVSSYLADKLLGHIITHEVKEMFYVKIENARVIDDGEGPPMIYVANSLGSKIHIVDGTIEADDTGCVENY